MNETKLFGNSNFICNNNLFDVRPKNLILILKNDKLFYQNNNKKNLAVSYTHLTLPTIYSV